MTFPRLRSRISSLPELIAYSSPEHPFLRKKHSPSCITVTSLLQLCQDIPRSHCSKCDPQTQSMNSLLLVYSELRELAPPYKPTTLLSTLFSSSVDHDTFLNEEGKCIDLHSRGSKVPVFSLLMFSFWLRRIFSTLWKVQLRMYKIWEHRIFVGHNL